LKATQQRTLGSNERELIIMCWEMGQALYRKRQLLEFLRAAGLKREGMGR
jgi:hypothetical protein